MKNKSAFTLIELLVVIVLIGITSLVAVPNVREFIINREYKNDVYKIATIANSLRNDLETKKADITSTLPYELDSDLVCHQGRPQIVLPILVRSHPTNPKN